MANPPPPKMPTPPKQPVASWRLKVGKAIPYLLGLFVLGGIIQVFLAGYGIENLGAQGMEYHITFAHILEGIPLLILIAGFVGADWRAGVVGIVLFALFWVQYLVLDSHYSAINAVHAANGALLILVAFAFMMRRLPRRAPPVAAASPPKPMVSVRPAAPPVQTPMTPRPPTPPQR